MDELSFGTGTCPYCSAPLDNHGLIHWPLILCPIGETPYGAKANMNEVVFGLGKPEKYFTFALPTEPISEVTDASLDQDLPPGWRMADSAIDTNTNPTDYDDEGFWYNDDSGLDH